MQIPWKQAVFSILLLLMCCDQSTVAKETILPKATKEPKMSPIKEIRPAAVTGTFYPKNKARLFDQIDQYLLSPPVIPGKLVGLITPHAGYIYSGATAGYSYKALEGRDFDTVIIVAPSHQLAFSGVSVYQGDAYQTPLGLVPIDKILSKQLLNSSPLMQYNPVAHQQEHAIEVQLPFIQRSLSSFSLVAVLMGSQDEETCQQLGNQLANLCKENKKILFIASSDLSHYHSYQNALSLDQMVEKFIANYDYQGLGTALAHGSVEACGGGAIISVMIAAEQQGATTAKILQYANSGDTAGDKERVVGYLAAALLQGKEKATREEPDQIPLSDQEKAMLLKIARQSLIQAVHRKQPIPVATNTLSPAITAKRGAFVTLKLQGELRGCIGIIIGQLPLYQIVAEMAAAAALEDPRFSPVTFDELTDITIEISVLSPLYTVTDPRSVQVGKDGLLIKKGQHTGVLLPQVPLEQGWDQQTFLQHLCIKAGLKQTAWHDPQTELLRFTAEVIHE